MSQYERFPWVDVPGGEASAVEGWDAIAARLENAVRERGPGRAVLVVECYPGVHESQIIDALKQRMALSLVVSPSEALLAPEKIEALTAPFLGGEDPVFGFLSGLALPQFFSDEKLAALKSRVASVARGVVLVAGCGARLVDEGTVFVYADMPRWEAQNRFRRNEISNLGVENRTLRASLQYKRAFFVDWRVADRWKRPLIAQWDFLLDTTQPCQPKMADGNAVRRGLKHAVTRPFRVVPFFDPAPWGGRWMEDVCGLDKTTSNYGWCFDCVPEENSLLLGFGSVRLEMPSINLVFDQARSLLGSEVHARFGEEFPIRFDFLDTMGGGNLSLQVHPLAEYIQKAFGMPYTQDESYYLLDAAPDACVFLGLRDGISPREMYSDLKAAQDGGPAFPAEKYANQWPAKKHDHFLIPAGTIHCSGRNAMVLEISATPYIFTFKMWDWNRMGLDGKPRPIHLEHAFQNIQWDRTTDWVRQSLINRVQPGQQGDGWRLERTGLHPLEFIDTQRLWFTKQAPVPSSSGVSVLNLVQGSEAVVESACGAFEPMYVHYAETFIIPAGAGDCVIRPVNGPADAEHAVICASIRC